MNISSDITSNNGSVCHSCHKSHSNIGCILGINFLQVRYWINCWPSKFSWWRRRCFREGVNENFRAHFACEDDRLSPGQETSLPLLDRKFERVLTRATRRIHYTVWNLASNIGFNIILPYALNISKLIPWLQVSNTNCNYTFLNSSVDAACRIHLVALDLNNLLTYYYLEMSASHVAYYATIYFLSLPPPQARIFFSALSFNTVSLRHLPKC